MSLWNLVTFEASIQRVDYWLQSIETAWAAAHCDQEPWGTPFPRVTFGWLDLEPRSPTVTTCSNVWKMQLAISFICTGQRMGFEGAQLIPLLIPLRFEILLKHCQELPYSQEAWAISRFDGLGIDWRQ